MTKAEFVKNNRGINNGEDLAEDFLSSIYDEIQINEIRMKDEVEVAPIATPALGLTGALTSVGRDYQREAYIAQSEGMVSKTDALFKTMVKTQRRGPVQRDSEVFFSASHIDHIKPMFEIVWTPILAGISAPLQVTDEANVVERCLEGFRLAVKIVCLFDLELERNAFVTTLSKLTSLMDFAAMKRKNVEAIRCLLDIAAINGNYLRSSWREVLFCISQLERFQLITQGVDSRSLPELGRKQYVSCNSRPCRPLMRSTAARSVALLPTRQKGNSCKLVNRPSQSPRKLRHLTSQTLQIEFFRPAVPCRA